MRSALGLVTAKAREKGLALLTRIEPGVPAWILGDAARVRQVLANLLSNAVKFTERGEVSVLVDAEPGEDGVHRVTFAVRDTGLEIPEAWMSRLFEPFSQLDPSSTRRHGGTGLGLAIRK